MKTKSVVGVILLSIALAVLALLLFLEHWRSRAGKSPWHEEGDALGWLMLVSIAIAIVFSVLIITRAIGKIVRSAWLTRLGIPASTREGARIGAYIAGFGSYPIALFLGFVIGGTFGGGLAEPIFGRGGIVIGIGVGMLVVLTITSTIAACLGCFIGGLIQRVAQAHSAR